jgi:hypothetical protein
VNLFNFSQTTAVFAKVDYTFGEDVQGVGGKAGRSNAFVSDRAVRGEPPP